MPVNKKSSKPANSSLADLYDAADASAASNMLSEGQHEVRLNSFTIDEKPTGAIATAVYECIDGDEEGKKGNSRYKLSDADGNAALGMNYFKRDLALLGYENVPGKKIKKTLQELTEAQPMCIVNVKVKDGYTNIFLQGVAEDAAPAEEEEAEEETNDEAEVEVGSQVEFTDPDDEDEKLQGEVVSIKDETATVLVGKKKYKVEGSDLTIVVAEEEEAEEESEEEELEEEVGEIEVGSRVKWTNDEDDEMEGKVLKIVDEVATVKDDDGDKHKVELENLELVED